MNLRDKHSNNNGMTLDSRTFGVCSRRMQDLINTPLGEFQIALGTEGMMMNKKTTPDGVGQASVPKNVILPPRITVKGATPTPPPRKKKVSADQQVMGENTGGNGAILEKSVQISRNLPGKNVNLYTVHTQTGLGGEGHGQCYTRAKKLRREAVFFNRPLQLIMDWMTNIANNMDNNTSCPPV